MVWALHCLFWPNSAGTLRSESETQRKPEVPASNRDEALFHFVKPSGVQAAVLPRPARGAGTLIPSAQRFVWAAKQPLGIYCLDN